jgi:transcriptional regulator with XRE-family HTH domain
MSASNSWADQEHEGAKGELKKLVPEDAKVSIRQIKAAFALLGWSQEELAEAARVSIPTIKRPEASEGPLGGRSETGDKIRRALQAAGVEFIEENGGGPGVRLRKPASGKSRK